jgi:hypothetical protein
MRKSERCSLARREERAQREEERARTGAALLALLDVAGVQAALLGGGVLPPPAALALLLVGQHRARARLAADRDVAAGVQVVGGHIHDAQEVPDLVGVVVGQRVVLDERAGAGGEALEHRVDLRFVVWGLIGVWLGFG